MTRTPVAMVLTTKVCLGWDQNSQPATCRANALFYSATANASLIRKKSKEGFLSFYRSRTAVKQSMPSFRIYPFVFHCIIDKCTIIVRSVAHDSFAKSRMLFDGLNLRYLSAVLVVAELFCCEFLNLFFKWTPYVCQTYIHSRLAPSMLFIISSSAHYTYV